MSNSFYIICTIVPIRPIIVLFSYSAFGCKSVIINQSIKSTASKAMLHSKYIGKPGNGSPGLKVSNKVKQAHMLY